MQALQVCALKWKKTTCEVEVSPADLWRKEEHSKHREEVDVEEKKQQYTAGQEAEKHKQK